MAEAKALKGRMGRPPKKTPQLIEALMKAIATGAPYRLCCGAVGIHYDTFMGWRQEDAEFARQVEKVAASGALKRLKKIEEHGEENFSALAWMLERRYPDLFGRPEVQLNLQTNIHNDNRQFTISVQDAEVMESRVLEVEGEMGDLFSGRLPPPAAQSGDESG